MGRLMGCVPVGSGRRGGRGRGGDLERRQVVRLEAGSAGITRFGAFLPQGCAER